jgi:pre-rRNA-processing protein TSR3
LSERGHFEAGSFPADVRRRLPFLLATNPQHFGRVGQLNSAEAFAAALAVLGHESQARELLAPFHGADAFFALNASRLQRYREARTPRATVQAERESFSDPR